MLLSSLQLQEGSVLTAVLGSRLSKQDVAKHASADDCWVIINDQVFDVTQFLDVHPGGRLAILASAGKDASRVWNMLHSNGAIERMLSMGCKIGFVGTLERDSLSE